MGSSVKWNSLRKRVSIRDAPSFAQDHLTSDQGGGCVIFGSTLYRNERGNTIHPKPKIRMFYVLSQNYQQFIECMHHGTIVICLNKLFSKCLGQAFFFFFFFFFLS